MRKRQYHKMSLSLEEVLVDGLLYDVDIQVIGEFCDQGIGWYEFWGKVGFDSHFGVENVEIYVSPMVTHDGVTFNADGNLLDKITEAIYNDDAKMDYIVERIEKDAADTSVQDEEKYDRKGELK